MKSYLKYIVSCTIIVIILCTTYFGIIKWRHENTKPYDYVQEYYQKKNEIRELICERKVDEDSYLYFLYNNKKDRISCLVVKKGILSYKIIVEQSTGLDHVLNKEYPSVNFTAYKKNNYMPSTKWIAWNIVDKDVKTVWIENQVANLIDLEKDSYKICYLIGNGKKRTDLIVKIEQDGITVEN